MSRQQVRFSTELMLIAKHLDHVRPTAAVSLSPRSSGGTLLATLEQLADAVRRDPDLANTILHLHGGTLMGRLSVDVLIEIFTYLRGDRGLVVLSQVCTVLREIVLESDVLWSQVCQQTYPIWFERISRPNYRRPSAEVVRGKSLYHSLFKAKLKCDTRWMVRTKPASNIILFPRGVHCIYFDDRELLVGCGAENEVLCYNLRTGKRRTCERRNGLLGHTEPVTTMQVLESDPNLVVTASLDSTLRCWNRSLMAEQLVFSGHTDKVWCLHAIGARLFSGSSDKSLRIWDIPTGRQLATLYEHKTSISALRVMKHSNGATLVTGSAGNTIRVFDIGQSTASCIAKLRGHEKGVFCLHCTPQQLFSGSLDNTVKLWDPRQGYRLLTTLGESCAQRVGEEESSAGVITFQCDDTKLVSGGPTKVMNVWDLRMYRLVDSIFGHEHWVTHLQFDDSVLVSASRDHTVRFWKINDPLCTNLEIPVNY